MEPLFTPVTLGDLRLPNRIVMASMTRSRADNAGLVPDPIQATYYAQRASAGLILSEGTWAMPSAIGALRVPGLFTDEQEAGWKLVVTAVHAAGGRIVSQLGHAGASSHPALLDGRQPIGPSAVDPGQRVFTASGFHETPTPHAMSRAEIDDTVAGYRLAALRAKRAGFNGVELHGAMAYLVAQFLSSRFNVRSDDYGGTKEKRARFLFEALEALISVWGQGRVGVKLSPTLTNFGGFHATDETVPTYDHVFERLNDLPLAYVQVSRPAFDVTGSPVAALERDVFRHYRARYRGALVVNGGFTFESANEIIADGTADVVAFARPFIANPDLVERFAHAVPLAAPDLDKLYQGGEEGYTTYPRAT